MNIFITGGCGFIGSNLAEYYSHYNHAIYVYDNLSSGRIENLAGLPNVNFIHGDITDSKLLEESMKNCDMIFHLAAFINVALSMERPIETIKINELGTINVLNAMVKNNIKKIIFASSAAVYGDSEECPKVLHMKTSPVSPYAITKLSCEYYLEMYARKFGILPIYTRFFNVFGERQSINSDYAAAIPIFIHSALKNEEIQIFGDGKQTRDFIYVKDLVRYLDLLASKGNGLYNIGYGKPITIQALAERIVSGLKSKSNIVYRDQRVGDVRHSYADVSKLTSQINLEIIGFEKGLENTFEYFKKNQKK